MVNEVHEKICPKCGLSVKSFTNPKTLETKMDCTHCNYHEAFMLIVDSQGEWKHQTVIG